MFKVVVQFENSEKDFEFTHFASAMEFAEIAQNRGLDSKMIGPGAFTKTMILTFPAKKFA